MKELLVRTLLVTLAVLSGLMIACGDKSVNNGVTHNTDFVASEPFDYTVGAPSHTGISLEGVNCEVNLVCTPELQSVSITGVRKVGSDSYADAEEYLRLLTVDVNTAGDVIEITVDQPSNTEWRSFNVEFDISIPRNYNIDFAIVNGTVILDSLEADAHIGIVNGNVYFDRIFGECNMEIVNGRTQGAVVLPAGGASTFSVVNGIMDMAIPRTTSAEFSASVVNGSISISDLLFHDYHETPNSVTGTLGPGNGAIVMSVVNGSISVDGY